MKKTFPCGHKGKGQYCHRCEDEERERLARETAKQEKVAVLLSIGVDLTGLPAVVARKAVEIVKSLETGTPYTHYKGKRLISLGGRTTISIPVGRNYRMVCEDRGGKTVPCRVLSHEEYNTKIL